MWFVEKTAEKKAYTVALTVLCLLFCLTFFPFVASFKTFSQCYWFWRSSSLYLSAFLFSSIVLHVFCRFTSISGLGEVMIERMWIAAFFLYNQALKIVRLWPLSSSFLNISLSPVCLSSLLSCPVELPMPDGRVWFFWHAPIKSSSHSLSGDWLRFLNSPFICSLCVWDNALLPLSQAADVWGREFFKR